MKKDNREPIPYQTWTLEQIKEELWTQEPYKTYFAQYDQATLGEFIDKYAAIKYEVFSDYKKFEEHAHSWDTQFLSKADKYIDAILQKKLFDIQCKWRANLIDVPHLYIIEDFRYWSKHIRDCPFLPIVTPDDIDLCIKFLTSEYDYMDKMFILGDKWQGYDHFKNFLEAEEEDRPTQTEEGMPFINCSPIPQIYTFFDTYRGTGGLINLPDLRGDWDPLYCRVGRDIEEGENARIQAEKDKLNSQPPTPPYVPKPYTPRLFPLVSELKKFVEKVENPESQKAFQLIYEGNSMERNDELRDAFIYLQAYKEVIPIEAHEDWREGVILALHKHEQLKTVESLPDAYDVYMMEFEDPDDFEAVMANRLKRHKPDPKDFRYQIWQDKLRWFKIGRKAIDGREDFDYSERMGG
jgi:hypothetical protein